MYNSVPSHPTKINRIIRKPSIMCGIGVYNRVSAIAAQVFTGDGQPGFTVHIVPLLVFTHRRKNAGDEA